MEYKTPEHKRLKNLLHYYKYIKPDRELMKQRSDYALEKYNLKKNDAEPRSDVKLTTSDQICISKPVNHTVNFD